MKFVSKSVLCASLFTLFSSVMAETTEFVVPRLVLKTVINRTPHFILVKDKITGKSFALPATQTTDLNFEITGSKNVVVYGDFREALAQDGQFLITLHDQSGSIIEGRESYMNICALPGGINDGSGFITGRPGSTIFKFLMANQEGGNALSSRTLKSVQCQTIEINLVFSEEVSRFRFGSTEEKVLLDIECTIIEN